jgi:RimJ/RimL family protein N-acetyltransferase
LPVESGEHIFYSQKLNRIITHVDPENIPSINLMKKLEYKWYSASWQVSENGETISHFYTFQKKLIE